MAVILTPDLCVIGAGASGLAVAEAARRLGASVVIVERGDIGGMSHKAGALAQRALAAKGILVRGGADGYSSEPLDSSKPPDNSEPPATSHQQ